MAEVMVVTSGQKISHLRKCFCAIVDRKAVNIDPATLTLIIQNELQIPTDQLDIRLQQALPYMVVSFIIKWAGWEKGSLYFSGSLRFKDWYKEFEDYLLQKTNHLINHDYKKALREIENEKLLDPKWVNKSVADIKSKKKVAPFTLEIQGPTKLLTALIFTNYKDDVQARCHKILPRVNLSLKELLNLPFISVHFKGPELEFERHFCPDYNRYLLELTDGISAPKVDFINKDRSPRDGGKHTRTGVLLDYLHKYSDYFLILKPFTSKRSRIEEYKIILDIFKADIMDVAVEFGGLLPLNFPIQFNIGESKYIRNKRIKDANGTNLTSNSVTYSELIIPKCDVKIEAFGAPYTVLGDGSRTFPTLHNTAKENCEQSFNVSIKYRCTFCKVEFADANAMSSLMYHYVTDHAQEHLICCFRCKKEFSVSDLSLRRWRHPCYCPSKSQDSSLNSSSLVV